MSVPVKFDEKAKIFKPAGNYPYYLLERADHVQQAIRLVKLISSFLNRQLSHTLILQKLKNSTCPGPVKFDEKLKIFKPAGNYPYYFLKRAGHVQQAIRLVWLI